MSENRKLSLELLAVMLTPISICLGAVFTVYWLVSDLERRDQPVPSPADDSGVGMGFGLLIGGGLGALVGLVIGVLLSVSLWCWANDRFRKSQTQSNPGSSD